MSENDLTATALARISQGDGGALEELLGLWLPEVERHLRRHASPRIFDQESGVDLAQSVCREVLERLRRGAFEYRGRDQFRNWLLGAADLKLRQRWRRAGAQRRAGEAIGIPLSAADDHAPAAKSPSREAAALEERERLESALERLDERSREAVRLYYLEGLRHGEIAARLGIGESHSRTILARGLARLASILHAARERLG